tara:strand:- start:1671 stop:2063 length:393 start_codon:yes stop_codon:yes gene_type:complete
MSIKLVTLFDGERIVTDLYETRFKHRPDVVCGYVIRNPQLVSMTRSLPSQMVEQTNEPEFRVVFTPWNPFAKVQQFKLNPNCIISVSDVREDVEKIFREEFYQEEKHEFDSETLELLYYDDPSMQNEVQQ